MINTDYILLETAKLELVEQLIDLYFKDKYVTHNGIELGLYKHKKEEKVLINFSNSIDNELFIFFFLSISTDIEFQNHNYIGWFSASDKITEENSKRDFGGRLDIDHFSTRVMLTTEMTEDYIVGYSDRNQKIKFNYSGKFRIDIEQGFIPEHIKKIDYQLIKEIQIEKNESETNQKGCGIFMLMILALIALVQVI